MASFSVTEDFSSDSNLDENELDHLVTAQVPQSTQNSTRWAIKAFEEWQIKRHLDINLAEIEPQQFGIYLRKFYAEVRTKSGKALSPSAMRCIRSGVYRYITGPPLSRAMNILVDKEFLPANKMFEARCKSYVREGNPKPKHYPSIGEGDMRKIMTYLKPYESPTKLVQYVWFMLAFNLARRGREGWTNMTKSSFEYKSDDNEEEYLTMSASETTKNWQGGSSSNAWDYSDVRIHASNKLDPPKNFLAVYRFYLSKLNPDCDKLFQRPKGKNWSKDGFWFDKAPMGKNTIGSMLSSISKSAGTSIVYTNHSVRATAITAMYQAGIDRSHICRITKHKREESLKPYISEPSLEQKRTCSTVLQQHLGLADSNESHPEAMTSTETDTNSGIMTPILSRGLSIRHCHLLKIRLLEFLLVQD